jgi:hypothetical protein
MRNRVQFFRRRRATEAGTKRCTSLRDRHLSNAKGQNSKSLILLACKSLILLARGGSG